MRLPRPGYAKFALYSLLAAAVLGLAGCGGSSSSSTTPPTPVNNTQPIEVNLGPANNYTNGLFTSVTICVPGTSNCQTIPDVLVDSGSEGLRLLSSAVTLSLPAVTDGGSNNLQECYVYGDGSYNWGGIFGADIKMAGETGSSVPIQIIDSSSPTTYPVPSACLSGGGPDENTVQLLGANGILGIGIFQQDCGSNCANSAVAGQYYLCSNSACSTAIVPVNYQVQNPVWTFQDYNGVLISLPSIPDTGAETVSGSMIFGVGTQSDNALGSAQIYSPDQSGFIQTAYQNVSYISFIDSGSNALFFLDASTLGIPDCSDNPGFYCPGSTQTYTVTNSGPGNGASGQVTFNIANADALFNANNGLNAAFNNLGGDSGTGPSSDYVDFGLPFFFGRKVFIVIENQIGPNNTVGPYWAY
jgi:Protein of unknown function (DUF3443)